MNIHKPLSRYMIVVVFTLLGMIGIKSAAQSADEPIMPTPVAALARTITIVGGQLATPGEWPWQVFVHAGPYMCGGTLIHETWVLTAAHCVTAAQNQAITPTAVGVVLGEYNRSANDGTEQQINVVQVIIHPDYDARINNNDIALLQLATPAVLGNAVGLIQPVLSPADDVLVVAGVQAMVTGWGTTAEGSATSLELREVMVPLVSNEQCNRTYGMITDNMLCAGYENGGKDSCQGDSGGPLVVPTADGGWKLAGVVSFGYGCARANFYGVYTRVSRYGTWLEGYIGQLQSTPPATPTPSAPLPTATPVPAISALLLPNEEATVTIVGANQAKTILEIPTGAVDAPTELFYSETQLTTQPLDAIRIGGRAFTLNARQDNLPMATLTFNQPVTMTILYTEEEINALNEAEITLFALQPTSGAWSETGIARIEHAPEANRLVVAIHEVAEYALGAPNHPVFLPVVIR